MSALGVLLRRLRPAAVAGALDRRREKILRGVRGVEQRMVELRPKEASRGAALFSHVIDPLLEPREGDRPAVHSLHWEVRRMAETLVELGFEVDAVSWTNASFVPQRHYDLVLDVRTNLERWAPLLDARAIKLLHCDTAHHAFHNQAQLERLRRLEERRGIRLAPHRLLPANRAIDVADCATILGNAFTIGTWAAASPPTTTLVRTPVSCPWSFPFPEDRNYATASRRFLWIGSDGFVHKGLDLVLEAFAGLPGFELFVCGPLFREPAFERAFYRELHREPNIHTLGWVDPASPRFAELARSSIGIVFPSCSEGGGVSALLGLHAGLLPVVTRESSVDLAPGLDPYLDRAEPAAIRERVQAIAARRPAELEAQSRTAWEHVRRRHTRERFAQRWRAVIAALIEGRARELDRDPEDPERDLDDGRSERRR
jgi:glycosyltransferase involved in cell wall biosynthesis